MKDYIYERIYDIVKQYFVVTCREKANDVTNEIIKSYNSEYRKYHNLNHITKCLDMVNTIYTLDAVQVNNISMAIIYHDIVYNPFSTDKRNEKNSVLRLMNDIPNILASDSGRIIQYMILATTHDPKDMIYPTDIAVKMNIQPYQKYICDIDLHQLGCGLNEFLYTESLIREEYKIVPDEVFYPARSKILQSFLDRSNIYYSRLFQDRFESNARRNIKYVLDRQDIFTSE